MFTPQARSDLFSYLAAEVLSRVDDRIAVFTGTTCQDRREEVKAAFNADPAKESLRILICTDAAIFDRA